MRIAVTGAGGQLGQAMVRRLAERHTVTALARADLDIADATAVERAVAALHPDAIVNCAAYNAVDRAEDDVPAALDGNAFGVQTSRPRGRARRCGARALQHGLRVRRRLRAGRTSKMHRSRR